MIFYTVGTQLPFDRLTKFVDEFAAVIDVPIYGQIGQGTYVPKNFEYCESMEVAEFENRFRQSDIIISHAGMGTILQSLVAGKIICICARKAEFSEHRNDHQVATVARFSSWNNVFEILTVSDLEKAFSALNAKKDDTLSQWASEEMLVQLHSLIAD